MIMNVPGAAGGTAPLGPHQAPSELSLDGRIEDFQWQIRTCEIQLNEIPGKLAQVDNDETNPAAMRKYGRTDQETFATRRQKLQKQQFDLRKELVDLQEELQFYEDTNSRLRQASDRISKLPSVCDNDAQHFALTLARELRRCYREGELEAPSREDRTDPCFHSDIEHALKNLMSGNGTASDFANDWEFVREHSDG
jgi:chromosome segregation ATPase